MLDEKKPVLDRDDHDGCYDEPGCCGHAGHDPRRFHHIGKFILMILVLVFLTGIIIVSILRDRIVNQQFRQVTVTGQGRVSYQPDIAIVTLGVQIDKAAKAEDALNQLNDKVNGIIAAISDNASVVSGYSANQQLTVKITDYDKDQTKLNKVIAAASKAGVNQVLNLSFDVSNANDLKQQARVKAIADAKDKSGALAAAAGVELKEISGWYENLVQAPTPYYSSAMGVGMGGGGIGGGGMPQVPSGSREIIIEIGVTYNLE
ncbi:MAG: SIMPL domain-containing protein [Candidatus Falkowbacteria bacterium]|nr:SIMPL domain-containing protein [Candidatus Falkowbacteria bacterium]